MPTDNSRPKMVRALKHRPDWDRREKPLMVRCAFRNCVRYTNLECREERLCPEWKPLCTYHAATLGAAHNERTGKVV